MDIRLWLERVDHFLCMLCVARFHQDIELCALSRHIQCDAIVGATSMMFAPCIANHFRDQRQQARTIVADDPDIDQTIIADE